MADEWPEIPFAELLAEPVRNGIYKKKHFHGRGVKIVNMGELFRYPRLRDPPMKRVELTETEQRRFSIDQGDLLFARRSLVAEGAGKCSVVLETPEPTTFESSIIRARPNQTRADSQFLYYYFNSPPGLHALDSIRRQVAVAGITGSDLVRLGVRLPPLSQQCAIARVLGTLDDKIELNRCMNETLDAMARALFKSWFVDFDPVRATMEGRERSRYANVSALFPDALDGEGKPAGWSSKPLDEIADFLNGVALQKFPAKDPGNSLPVIKIAELRGGVTPKSGRASRDDPRKVRCYGRGLPLLVVRQLVGQILDPRRRSTQPAPFQGDFEPVPEVVLQPVDPPSSGRVSSNCCIEGHNNGPYPT